MNEATAKPITRRRLTLWKRIVFGLFGTILCLALLEGLCAGVWTVFGVYHAFASAPRVQALKEDSHCQYDEELGWVNIPATQIEDFYGPDRTLTINADGVRGLDPQQSYTTASELFRIICLGDSFTLGYGVDDRNTFPHQLQESSPGIESINMGQGGYSVGQSYLWLKRQGESFAPDLVVALFIVEDFRRLALTRTANGYGTPEFRAERGELLVSNQPVPPRLPVGDLLPSQVRVGQTLVQHSSLAKTIALPFAATEATDDTELLYIGAQAILEMKKLCDAWQSQFAFVLMPTMADLDAAEDGLAYQICELNLRNFATQQQILFLDLQPVFVEQTVHGNEDLFLKDDAFHHYSPAGNALVAEQLSAWFPHVVDGYPAPTE